MTISHRRTSRSSNNSTAREETISSHNEPSNQRTEDHLRGSTELPPTIPNMQDRPLIEPVGDKHWTATQGRTPSSVLTCLLKHYHPGLILYRGKTVVASTWKHYQAAKDSSGKSKADFVDEGFWLRFRFNPAMEAKSREQVGHCCADLLGSMMYYARITATMAHFRDEGRKICDKIAGQFYLTREEYIARRQEWCSEDCWAALATEWSSPEFKEKSMRNRGNRQSSNFKPHKGGSNSIAVIRQKLSRKYGRDVSDVEAWVHTHRGSNPEDISSLNTESATECLETYKAKAIELNGPDFDWLRSPVDVRALYQCNCGRQHGKWATFNGTIDDSEALPQLNRSHASVAARRQRQEEEEQLRKEAHDGRLAKQYADNMLEWGRMVQARDQNFQMFMESVAVRIGMPLTAVPSPLPPAPPPPVYATSSSPNPSRDNAGTHGSCIREETPDEILSRIAYRGFGVCANMNGGDDDAALVNGATGGANNGQGGQGFGNGTTSGGGNYSPPQVDGFPIDALC